MRRSRPTSCRRSTNRSGQLEARRQSRRLGKARVSDGSEAWRSEPSNGGFHEPSGVLSSLVKPWLVGIASAAKSAAERRQISPRSADGSHPDAFGLVPLVAEA